MELIFYVLLIKRIKLNIYQDIWSTTRSEIIIWIIFYCISCFTSSGIEPECQKTAALKLSIVKILQKHTLKCPNILSLCRFYSWTQERHQYYISIFKAYKGFRSWEEITNRFQEPSYLGRADHRKKILKPRFFKNIVIHSFVGSGIDLWNSLSITTWDSSLLPSMIKSIINFAKS